MSLIGNQKNVVASTNNISCLALPGSGKSFTSVKYISRVVNDVPDCKVVAISFTRKAALELKEKLHAELGQEKMRQHVKVSTFDSLFYQELKRYLDVKKLTIMSENERRNIITMTKNKIKNIHQARKGKKKHKELTDNDINAAIDKFDSYLDIPSEVAAEDTRGYDFYREYVAMRTRKKLWEFSSISVAVVRGVQAGMFKPFNLTHLVVDEFQDTSDIQYEWLRNYANTNAKVAVVGDDDQAIYSFRFSKGYRNFIRFKEDFRPDCFVLNICFRCKPAILARAKNLIEHNQSRVHKEMKSIFSDGGDVHFRPYVYALPKANENDEPSPLKDIPLHDDALDSLLNEIQHDKAKDWAILARTNDELWPIRALLADKGLPLDDVPDSSVFNSYGYLMLEKLFYTVIKSSKHYIEDLLVWLGESGEDIAHSIQAGGLSKKYAFANMPMSSNKNTLLMTLIYKLQDAISTSDGVALIQEFLKEGFNSHDKAKQVEPDPSNPLLTLSKSDKSAIDLVLKILSNLGQPMFRDSVMKLVRFSKNTKMEKEDSGDGESNTIQLLTLHSSKGLEFKNVIIYNISEGSIPSQKSTSNDENKTEGIEEERRLLFVGMTRAMENLYLLYDAERPSQFIAEI